MTPSVVFACGVVVGALLVALVVIWTDRDGLL